MEAVEGIDAVTAVRKGGMEADEALGLAAACAGALGRGPQLPVALGIEDHHRLAALHRLGDQQFEQPGLTGPGGADDQQMAGAVADRQPHRGLAGAESVQPVGAQLGMGRHDPLGTHPNQVEGQLGMLGIPVEAPAEPEIGRTALAVRAKPLGIQKAQRLSAEACPALTVTPRGGQPAQPHQDRQHGQQLKGTLMQCPVAVQSGRQQPNAQPA